MTKTNIKTNLKSLLSILFILSLSLILIISDKLIIHHNSNAKQINSSPISTIRTNTYQVIKVYYNNQDQSFYLHTANLLDAPCAFDILLKDIQGDPNSILEDLNKAYVGSKLSIKYDTKRTFDKYDDEILEYKFLDNETYKQDGKIKQSIVTIDNKYLNTVETEEGLFKILSDKKLNNNQNVTLEIDNNTGAVINLKEN